MNFTLPKYALVFTCLIFKSFENTARKGEIARNEQISFATVFSTVVENILPFSSNLKIVVCKPFQFGRV